MKEKSNRNLKPKKSNKLKEQIIILHIIGKLDQAQEYVINLQIYHANIVSNLNI